MDKLYNYIAKTISIFMMLIALIITTPFAIIGFLLNKNDKLKF